MTFRLLKGTLEYIPWARHYFGLSITDDEGGEEGSEKSGQEGPAHRLGHRRRRAQSVRTGWERGKDEEARWRKLEQQQRLRLSAESIQTIWHYLDICRKRFWYFLLPSNYPKRFSYFP